jgi:hypothetical protein
VWHLKIDIAWKCQIGIDVLMWHMKKDGAKKGLIRIKMAMSANTKR